MYALFKDGVQITDSVSHITAAYIDAFALRECYELWKGAKLLKEGYEIREVEDDGK